MCASVLLQALLDDFSFYILFLLFGLCYVFQPLQLVSEFWDQQPVLYWAHFVHATMWIYQILDLDPTIQNGLVLGISVSGSILYLPFFVIAQRNFASALNVTRRRNTQSRVVNYAHGIEAE